MGYRGDVGSVNDPTFGLTIMFGQGGIFVELLKDVTFRVALVNKSQISQMLTEIRGAPMLKGVRGDLSRDRAALVDILYQYAIMVSDLADEVSETDANPILVYEEGKAVKVVDARIILKNKG